MRTLRQLGTTIDRMLPKSNRLNNKCIKNMIKLYSGTDWKDVVKYENIVKKNDNFIKFKYPVEFNNLQLQVVKWNTNNTDRIDDCAKSMYYINRSLYGNILCYIHNEDDKLSKITALSRTDVNCFDTMKGYHLFRNIGDHTAYSLHMFSAKGT